MKMLKPFPIQPDLVKAIRKEAQAATKNLPDLAPSDEAILNLEFQKGETVIERATGITCTVLAGTRRTVAV